MSTTNSIDTEFLNGGEIVALSSVEITAIPGFSTLEGRFADYVAANAEYKRSMANLLSEIHQLYRTEALYSGVRPDYSVEMLLVTEPVSNQPYAARIRTFLVARAIEGAEDAASKLVAPMVDAIKTTLLQLRYSFRDVDADELMDLLGGVNRDAIRTLVKEEKLDNLQNRLLPQCLSFDRIPLSDSDFGRIANVLIEHPNCAVSFQLIPTEYEPQEYAALGNMQQALDQLAKGIADPNMGNMSFSLAEKHADTYRYYAGANGAPVFQFNIVVYGSERAASNISASIYAHLNSSSEGSISMRSLPLMESEADLTGNFYPLPWAIAELLPTVERDSAIWAQQGMPYAQLYRIPFIVSAEEASEFFRIPIGGDSVGAGYEVNESSQSGKTYADGLINSGDIDIGRLRSSSHGDSIGIRLSDLAKHMLVVGTPGSGKTTFSVGLLDRLWKEHGIPFLVIEPAKNEYRALVQSIPDLQVFTPGKNFISPFVFNPFVPPKNVKLETYKSTLKTAFAAGVSMTTPLDKIFEEAINNCYSDYRWLDSYTSADKGQPFNITDFVRCFQETFDEIGYTGDARNIGRAGVVRLNSLVNLFDNYHSIPIEDLLSKPTIIELAAIENSEQKSLIIALLLLSIMTYVNSNYLGEGGLRNVILLEEAHVLLDAETNTGQEDANPSSIAQGLVKRMLAEIRSYGVGIIIADQSPRKVTTDVVALTDMKVAFRLVEASDKQILADSINMDESQTTRLGKLRPGEAFLFFNRLDEPEEVIVPNYRLDNEINITLSDESIRQLSTYWDSRRKLLRPYPECEITPYCDNDCDYECRVLAREVARRIFKRNFKKDSSGADSLRYVLAHISELVVAELNDEEFTRRLLSCVKVHLWRRILNETQVRVTHQAVEKSLSRR